jgi:hypothetical protein
MDSHRTSYGWTVLEFGAAVLPLSVGSPIGKAYNIFLEKSIP